MDKASVERLRFDRRLQRRPGWAEETDREAFLASLPDVSDKMTTCAEEEPTAEAALGTATAEKPAAITLQGVAPAAAPAATAGDFSASGRFGHESDPN